MADSDAEPTPQEPQRPEPELPSAPDPDLIRTIQEGDDSALPVTTDPSLVRRVDLEDPTDPVRIFIQESDDE